MNKLTKTLLILPVIALTTIGCGEAEPRIETTNFNGQEIIVNCTDKTMFDKEDGWGTRSEAIESVPPAGRQLMAIVFDGILQRACN